MKHISDIRIIVLICCLLQGFALGVRMIKVSIPAFKMRGESAFMECQYELNRTHGPQIISTGHRERDRYTPHAGGELHYVDSADVERQPVHRRTHQGKRQYQQRRQQHQPMAMRQYQSQSQSQTERHNPPLPEKSPYGHSVYRGSAASGYLGGRVGASVHSSGAGGGGNGVGGSSSSSGSISYMPDFGRDDRYDESDEEEEETQEEGESLYAIKWYKDNEEFYRYVPKARPPKTSYRVDGVRVIEELSDASRVLLRGLTLNSTGLYRCEISAEAPNFSSVQGEGRMDIVFLPRDGPHIRGQQHQYQIGEYLTLNCTSGKSHPASHLQWFVNDQPILEEQYLRRYNDIVHKHGLITSILGLQLELEPRHFHDGDMRVKCLASISPVLWKGGRESILQRRPGIIDNRETMLLVRSDAGRIESNLLRLLTITIILARIGRWLLQPELT
ncbi:uncharacterized protein LOC6575273 [Drosophila mojavensis]|uniref:Ig-like domain-containing protein n=1 Tax=Drosophila mojavensis TaxID=7230 RepID=B4KA72_DROMO|nr:uncharacterized protein LOC6575273 [Drosophila mojavensis]EDW16747.1 uncharacterized protein Dmoj_GI22058 [Drosophila mojavensis]